MGRGGARPGAGRKSTWNNKTKAMKLPARFEKEIFRFARLLDSEALVKPDEFLSALEAGETQQLTLLLQNLQPEATQESLQPPIQTQPESLTFPLTPAQEEGQRKLKTFLHGQQNYFRLTGAAQTGKSYLICQFLKWLQQQPINVVVSATTNKAFKNFYQLAQEAQINVSVYTLAQLLGQQFVFNPKTGVEEELRLESYELVIVEEFSLINPDNFQDIHNLVSRSRVNQTQTKIIFVGDPEQLPPVGSKKSIIATSPLIKAEHHLTQVMGDETELVKVAETIRRDPFWNTSVYPFCTSSDATVVCLPRSDWWEKVLELFGSKEYHQNPDYVRLLVGRNQTAAQLNADVRQRLWGQDAPPYLPGERLIAQSPVFRLGRQGDQKQQWKIVLNNAEECEVIDKASLKTFSVEGWHYWEVPVRTDDGLSLALKILTPDCEMKRQEKIIALQKKKDWNQFIALAKSFDNLFHAYAITTHQAQGASIDYIYLDLFDISRGRDLQTLLYTALSCAQKSAFIPLD